MGVAVPVGNHWQCQQQSQRKLLGREYAAFTWCIFQKNPWIWTVQSDLLIPEQILLLGIILIKLDNVSYITYWGFGLVG